MNLVTNPLLIACAATVLATSATSLAGSLWVNENNNERSMFADKVARDIGDTVTIVIDESTQVTQTAALNTFDNSQGGFGLFPALNATLQGFLQILPNIVSRSTGGTVAEDDVTVPTLDFATTGKWNGGGETENTLNVQNIGTAVTVVDVLPNGNLVVEGAKIIRTANENQYGYMRGIVRPVDIASDNTIPSSKVADAQVEFVPEGELTEAQKKGWLLKAWDKVKPF
ncbi:MAG: flagellar basal body L-ring protein FlgH [Verrucomicrobia bacterium]|jgi:flagellar L-ring protein precursor FlgH|nr:flagellar basal body L-ring protein FlgH [Verrucomicrobiota bacterium]